MSLDLRVRTFASRMEELLVQFGGNFTDLKNFLVLHDFRPSKRGCRTWKKVQTAKHRQGGLLWESMKPN